MWFDLKKPILALAPLDDVTDVVFRQIVTEVAKPDVLFTEFTNVDALCSQGRESQKRRLVYAEEQRPIIAQIWGSKPENFCKVAREIRDRGFDGIDINMGCPDRTVVKEGLCSALIENHSLAEELIRATQEGWENNLPSPSKRGSGRGGEDSPYLPISVKTRIGIKKPVTEEWISFLLQFDLVAITVHGRTVKEMSKVPAHWDEIQKAVKIRDSMFPLASNRTLILGNGDILSREQALEYSNTYGVDGVMIGRGIFKDLWFFDPKKTSVNSLSLGERVGERGLKTVPLSEKLRVLARHIQLWRETYGNSRPFDILKKFIKIYISGFEGAADMRKNLMNVTSLEELEARVTSLRG